MKKGAALLGIGVGNVWSVECDERGRMIPAELEKRVREAKDKVRSSRVWVGGVGASG